MRVRLRSAYQAQFRFELREGKKRSARYVRAGWGGGTCVQVRKPWLRTSSSQQPLCSNAMAPKLTVSVTSVKQQLLLPCKQTVSVWQTERV